MHRFAIIIAALMFSCTGAIEALPSSNDGAQRDIGSIESTGTMALSGNWIFCPDRLLLESDFSHGIPPDCSLQKVPGPWTSYKGKNGPLPGTGAGTYRLSINLPEVALDHPKAVARALADLILASVSMFIERALGGEICARLRVL